MVELIGVMVVIAILLITAGVSVTKNIKRSNREAVVSELRIFSTAISDAYYDLGSPSFDPTVEADITAFKRWLATVESDYLAVTFDMSTLTPVDTGFEVTVSAPLDTYGGNYKFWFVTKQDMLKYAMVASGGDDGHIASDGYSTQNYSDDIVLIVRPKS